MKIIMKSLKSNIETAMDYAINCWCSNGVLGCAKCDNRQCEKILAADNKEIVSKFKNWFVKVLEPVLLQVVNLQSNFEELRFLSNFEIEYFNEDGKWYMFQSICQLGGCSHDEISFPTEKEALYEAIKRSILGGKQEITPCHSCYMEYLRDTI